MDLISHALWTNLVFKELPLEQRCWAIGFSVVPDIISFSVVTTKIFIKRTLSFQVKHPMQMPKYVFELYNITHSAVVWLGVFLILKIIGLDWYALAFCGWGFHILLDIFTHSKDFFPTPILWPFSMFHFSGIKWMAKKFMIFNYLLLAILYLIFYF